MNTVKNKTPTKIMLNLKNLKKLLPSTPAYLLALLPVVSAASLFHTSSAEAAQFKTSIEAGGRSGEILWEGVDLDNNKVIEGEEVVSMEWTGNFFQLLEQSSWNGSLTYDSRWLNFEYYLADVVEDDYRFGPVLYSEGSFAISLLEDQRPGEEDYRFVAIEAVSASFRKDQDGGLWSEEVKEEGVLTFQFHGESGEEEQWEQKDNLSISTVSVGNASSDAVETPDPGAGLLSLGFITLCGKTLGSRKKTQA